MFSNLEHLKENRILPNSFSEGGVTTETKVRQTLEEKRTTKPTSLESASKEQNYRKLNLAMYCKGTNYGLNDNIPLKLIY